MKLKHMSNHPEVVGRLLAVQWFTLCLPMQGTRFPASQGTKNPQAVQCDQNKKNFFK